jgi:hypothetical protein
MTIEHMTPNASCCRRGCLCGIAYTDPSRSDTNSRKPRVASFVDLMAAAIRTMFDQEGELSVGVVLGDHEHPRVSIDHTSKAPSASGQRQ